MSAHRLPLGLLAPVALVILITALGFLQYRWVGQVRERDRDQLRQSLDRRAREFAADFDREIGRAYQVFAPEPGLDTANPERFTKQLEEWQKASPFAGLVKHAYYAKAQEDDFALYRFDPAARRFDAIAWPDALAPARARLTTAHARSAAQFPGTTDFIAFAATPVLPTIPAILIPETQLTPITRRQADMSARGDTTINMMVTVRSGRNHVVLELDRDFMAAEMLPALTSRHFPETGADSFRVAVINAKSDSLFSRGVPAGQSLDAQTADAAATFFGLRMEMFRTSIAAPATAMPAGPPATWSAVRVQPGTAPATTTPAPPPMLRVTPAPDGTRSIGGTRLKPTETSQVAMVIEQNSSSVAAGELRSAAGWTLLLQHAAGSLDAAVGLARRRNLFLSFGILSVLAASAGLVMVNARRSEKLAAQQMDFVATVSHELRTPLAVIRSAAQNLSAGVVHDASQAKRYGDLIESEGRRLTDMVEQVLEYAGLSDARRRPPAKAADAGAIVRDVVASSSSLNEAADMAFDVRSDPDVPLVLVDEDGIRRALHNLIGNALKYGGDGRWVGVTVSRGRGSDDRFVLLSVADRGRGIPPDDLAHIFEPFYRGRHARDQQIRGNGLGLSLVKRIVEAHNGRVTVQSVPAQGTTFILFLPIAAGAPTEATAELTTSSFSDAAADRGGRPA